MADWTDVERRRAEAADIGPDDSIQPDGADRWKWACPVCGEWADAFRDRDHATAAEDHHLRTTPCGKALGWTPDLTESEEDCRS